MTPRNGQDVLNMARELYGLELAPELGGRLDLLADELLRWNQRIRLVGHHDPGQVMSNLFLDALALLPHLKGGTLLDIGSGAGFPGLVLALAEPRLSVTMLEGRAKKVSFQKQAVRLLGLMDRVTPLAQRAGQWQGGPFDMVCLRAVTDLQGSLQLARPYVAKGGRILLQRGPQDRQQAMELGMEVHPYTLGPGSGQRLICTAHC